MEGFDLISANTGSVVAAVTAILFFAAYLQSATGFGFSLVCMALMPLVLPVDEAITVVAIASFGVNLLIIFANRAALGLIWRAVLPLSVGMVLGIPLGYYGLRVLDREGIVRLLGLALVLIALVEFLQKRFIVLRLPERSGAFFGLLGGVLGGAFNVSGPPVVAYAYSMRWSKVETVAILQTVFLCGAIVRNLLMVEAGEYEAPLLTLVAGALPTSILAVWLGKLTLDRLPQAALKTFVFVLIFVIGLRYVIFG